MKKQYNDAASRPVRMQLQTQPQPPGQLQPPSGSTDGQGPAAVGTPRQPRQLLSGDKWYTQTAFRALNQAVGRCIRHRYDYGAIILFDTRFKDTGKQVNLSKW